MEIEGYLFRLDAKAGIKGHLHPIEGNYWSCHFKEAMADELANAWRHYVRLVGTATEKKKGPPEISVSKIEIVEPPKEKDDIERLAGLGKEIWKDVDVIEYIRKLRKED